MFVPLYSRAVVRWCGVAVVLYAQTTHPREKLRAQSQFRFSQLRLIKNKNLNRGILRVKFKGFLPPKFPVSGFARARHNSLAWHNPLIPNVCCLLFRAESTGSPPSSTSIQNCATGSPRSIIGGGGRGGLGKEVYLFPGNTGYLRHLPRTVGFSAHNRVSKYRRVPSASII